MLRINGRAERRASFQRHVEEWKVGQAGGRARDDPKQSVVEQIKSKPTTRQNERKGWVCGEGGFWEEVKHVMGCEIAE
jgi:hypothetical protein